MEPNTPSETEKTRTKLSLQRGNFYFGLGFALLIGLVLVVGLGALGITSLGIFSVSTAMAMIAIAITLLSLVSFVTLTTLRRTIELLSRHETALSEQADRHADLASKVQSQWRAEQVLRDRSQDDSIATISARQDALFVDGQPLTNGAHVAPASRRATPSPYNPFQGGQVHPVRDIEGIGEHYGKLLDELGLKDTRQLWNADTTYVAGALKVTPTAVDGWQCMAELMAVKGIGKQYAELLVRADVSSIDELCAETPQALLNRIHKLEQHQGNRIQGNTIGIKSVQSWINAAQAHHGLAPAVVGFNGNPGV
jgi:predicted flap endonuclease-1-like 5' DNA nuclease